MAFMLYSVMGAGYLTTASSSNTQSSCQAGLEHLALAAVKHYDPLNCAAWVSQVLHFVQILLVKMLPYFCSLADPAI